MLDELKKSKVLRRNNRFEEFQNVNYFKEIKRSKSLQKAETYLKPSEHVRWNFFENIFNGSQSSQ